MNCDQQTPLILSFLVETTPHFAAEGDARLFLFCRVGCTGQRARLFCCFPSTSQPLRSSRTHMLRCNERGENRRIPGGAARQFDHDCAGYKDGCRPAAPCYPRLSPRVRTASAPAVVHKTQSRCSARALYLPSSFVPALPSFENSPCRPTTSPVRGRPALFRAVIDEQHAVPDSSPYITYSPVGAWGDSDAATASYTNGTFHFTQIQVSSSSAHGRTVLTVWQGASLKFAFNGTGVSLHGAYRANHVRLLGSASSPRSPPRRVCTR